MENRYCGACRGERGCKDCKSAVKTAAYESVTTFAAEEFGAEGASLSDAYFLVADLGTTTLGFVCADASGHVLASYGTENPQRAVAADVIGRIDAACRGAAKELKNQIREALAKGFLFVHQKAGSVLRKNGKATEKLKFRIALAGNTTMVHLLMEYPAEGLAKYPFTPYSTEALTLPFSELFSETSVYEDISCELKGAEVFVFPALSAFVGGDALVGAYGLSFPGIAPGGKASKEGTYLLADLGTNGELILSVDGRIYATAAAMGTAFEGGRFAYASDLFALLAKALEEGVIDETGLLSDPYFTEGFQGLYQEDIRTFQLAKGAIRAGIELLCKRAGIGVAQVDVVYLAGGAGRYCKSKDLVVTGCLPVALEGKITMVGNSCIGGLLCYLKNAPDMVQWKGEVLNAAEEPEFEELYYHFMEFRKDAL